MITIMIAVERTSQIHQICKLVILTGESFGCALSGSHADFSMQSDKLQT
jgi:hypothetical protein